MAFRIVSIESPSELHVSNGQLLVEQESRSVTIPVNDTIMLIVGGPNIRMTTMAQTLLADSNVVVLHLGKNRHPAALTVPMVANARQTKVAYEQVGAISDLSDLIWQRIVTQKIENQARALAILGLGGAEEVWEFSRSVLPGDVGMCDGAAARAYFSFLHPGLNRRTDDPLNSCLNYGYAIVRAANARALVTTGFIPCFGLHHHSQLNAFNLADDMIEPHRPCVDIMACEVLGPSNRLSKEQRSRLRETVHMAVMVEGRKISILEAVDAAADSLHEAIRHNDPGLLKLPVVISPELVHLVRS